MLAFKLILRYFFNTAVYGLIKVTWFVHRADESVQTPRLKLFDGPAHCEVVKIKHTCLWDNTSSSLEVYACREITAVRNQMNHQLTIVSKKSGTVQRLGEQAGNNKGKRFQKRGRDEGRRFWLCCIQGRWRKSGSPLRLTLAESHQTTISGRLPDDQ